MSSPSHVVRKLRGGGLRGYSRRSREELRVLFKAAAYVVRAIVRIRPVLSQAECCQIKLLYETYDTPMCISQVVALLQGGGVSLMEQEVVEVMGGQVPSDGVVIPFCRVFQLFSHDKRSRLGSMKRDDFRDFVSSTDESALKDLLTAFGLDASEMASIRDAGDGSLEAKHSMPPVRDMLEVVDAGTWWDGRRFSTEGPCRRRLSRVPSVGDLRQVGRSSFGGVGRMSGAPFQPRHPQGGAGEASGTSSVCVTRDRIGASEDCSDDDSRDLPSSQMSVVSHSTGHAGYTEKNSNVAMRAADDPQELAVGHLGLRTLSRSREERVRLLSRRGDAPSSRPPSRTVFRESAFMARMDDDVRTRNANALKITSRSNDSGRSFYIPVIAAGRCINPPPTPLSQPGDKAAGSVSSFFRDRSSGSVGDRTPFNNDTRISLTEFDKRPLRVLSAAGTRRGKEARDTVHSLHRQVFVTAVTQFRERPRTAPTSAPRGNAATVECDSQMARWAQGGEFRTNVM